MNVVHDFVRVSLPSYFKSIPIPKDFSGFGDLSWQEILRLVAFIVLFGLIVYSVFRSLVGSSPASNSTPKQEPEDSGEEKDQGNSDPDEDRVVNLKVEKDKEKVVTTRDMEDLGDQAVFCRCWRSSKFPMCDGTHLKHNNETGDNVGPLVIRRQLKEPESKKED